MKILIKIFRKMIIYDYTNISMYNNYPNRKKFQDLKNKLKININSSSRYKLYIFYFYF